MGLPISDVPEILYAIAALPDGAGDDYIPTEEEGLTLVSLTDEEEGVFAPVWTTEEALTVWAQDFNVKVISVQFARDTLLPLLREGGCHYLAIDLQPGQEQFPPDQVLVL